MKYQNWSRGVYFQFAGGKGGPIKIFVGNRNKGNIMSALNSNRILQKVGLG